MKLYSVFIVCSIFYSPSYCNLAQQLDAYIQAHTDCGYFSGTVLIAKDNEIILSKGYGMCNYEHAIPNTPHTKFKLSSLTKPFVALAIMQLHEKKLLNMQDPISKYIPDYPDGSAITIHHLLSHTSGIRNYTALPNFDSFKKQHHDLSRLIERFKHLPLYFEPGSSYKFSNSNYVLLAYIIETVSGISCKEYVMNYICKPSGMKNTGIVNSSEIIHDRAQGYTLGNQQIINADYHDDSIILGLGFLYSTVEDLYVFNQALCTDQLAQRESLEIMFKPYAYIGDKADNIQYGYGWATIEIDGHVAKKHLGDIDGFTSALYRFPDDNIFIVVLSNFQQLLKEPLSFDLAHIIFGMPYTLPQKHDSIAVDAAIFKNYVGTYRYKNIMYEIAVKGNTLVLEQPEKPPYYLLPNSITHFFAYGVPLNVEFLIDEKGTAQEITTTAFGTSRKLKRVNS